MEEQKPDPSRSRPYAARMFQTRSQAWREAGLLRQINPRAVRRARFEALLLLPLFVGVVILYVHREDIAGKGLNAAIEVPAQIVAVVVLMILGWVIARAAGRAFGPMLFRRMEPATAGTVGFLIRLITVALTLVVALRVAGVEAKTLALASAFTAVIVGLAAQQTLGNVIAGTMLLSTRPFRVGDRVRLQGGALGGPIEGVVGSLGLFYTTFASGEESIMIPNSVVLNALVIQGEEPLAEAGSFGSGRRRVPEPPRRAPAEDGVAGEPAPAAERQPS